MNTYLYVSKHNLYQLHVHACMIYCCPQSLRRAPEILHAFLALHVWNCLYKLAEIIRNRMYMLLLLINSASLYKQFHTCRTKKLFISLELFLRIANSSIQYAHAIDKDYLLKLRDMYSILFVNCNFRSLKSQELY